MRNPGLSEPLSSDVGVDRGGIEPPTRASSERRSTSELPIQNFGWESPPSTAR